MAAADPLIAFMRHSMAGVGDLEFYARSFGQLASMAALTVDDDEGVRNAAHRAIRKLMEEGRNIMEQRAVSISTRTKE
jgi:hypothetical protein